MSEDDWRDKLAFKHTIKNQAWRRERRRCFYCERQLKYNQTTLDHIVPECFGGPLELGNVVVACFECNNERGNMPANIFLILKMTGGLRPIKSRTPGKRLKLPGVITL